jgi:hypothetical protein
MDTRKTRNAAQTSAQSYFTKSANSQETAKKALKKERSAVETKITKLRELRLAKEADERSEAEKIKAEAGPAAAPPPPKPKAPAKAKPVRFSY